MNAEQSINQQKAQRLRRVGGKSETEFVVNRSLSSTAANSKKQNFLATESAEEKEARLRVCILQPIMLCISLVIDMRPKEYCRFILGRTLCGLLRKNLMCL